MSKLIASILLPLLLISVPATAIGGINPNGPSIQASTAKCRELGYSSKPELLQACVRAMRADYCGDGISHTVAGTPINLYDQVGIQSDNSDWKVEAEWTKHGAACVSSTAVMRRTSAQMGCKVPVRASCGVQPTAHAIVTELS
jgi:hypothetical protein